MKAGAKLRWLRIAVSSVVFALITAMFVAAGSVLPSWGAWLARVQLLPAAMSFAMTVFVVWIILTLVFGRIYCSSICPLGYVQDIAARVPRLWRRGTSRTYHYGQPKNALRYTVLAIMVLSLMLGLSVVPLLLDPYSAYARMALNLLRPVWDGAASLLGIPAVKIGIASWLGFVIAVVTLVVVASLAARNGRTWCNTICPVGTTLGLVSRYSIFHIDINTDRCIQCRRCEHKCKARCIDLTDHVVDMSRCVVCFDCLTDCPNDAIHYTLSSHRLSIPMMQRVERTGAPAAQIDSPTTAPKLIDRRRFMATGLILAAAPAVLRADKALRRVTPGPTQRYPIAPPGGQEMRQFLERCTGCGLCVASCPQGIIRPSTTQYGVRRPLHPYLDFQRGFCSYGCTECNNVCPTDALQPLTLHEKQRTRIGTAHCYTNICIGCGTCAKQCPRHAITMTKIGTHPVATVNTAICIGCGGCQYVCPAYPHKAIIVDGLSIT